MVATSVGRNRGRGKVAAEARAGSESGTFKAEVERDMRAENGMDEAHETSGGREGKEEAP